MSLLCALSMFQPKLEKIHFLNIIPVFWHQKVAYCTFKISSQCGCLCLLIHTKAHKLEEDQFSELCSLFCSLRASVRGDNCCLQYTHASCKDSPGKVCAVQCIEINTTALIGLSAGSQEIAVTHTHFYNPMTMKRKNLMWHARLCTS